MSISTSAPTTHKLANGLTAILHPIAATDVVTVDIWVNTGGRHEPPELLGVSHFLEHMVFKGSERLGPGCLDQAIEGRGGMTNAVTSQDYTHYYITVAAHDLAETLPDLAEVVTQAAVPEAEFDRERQVVLEEIRRAEDNPDHCAYHQLLDVAYTEHPYRRPVLGTVDSLMALTPEMVRAYHRSWYRPENLTVVIVGRFELDEALALVEANFGHLPLGHMEVPLPTPMVEPPLTSIRRSEMTQPRLEQARLILAWPGASVVSWEDACCLELLAAILGGSRTSRLVQTLREDRGWVRGIGSASAVHLDPGLFYVSAYLETAQIEQVEAAVLQEVARLHSELVSGEELDRAKRILTNEFIFSTESPGQLAQMYGFYHLSGGIELVNDYLERVKTLTPVLLQQVAQRYLSPQRYVVTILKPKTEASVRLPEPALAV